MPLFNKASGAWKEIEAPAFKVSGAYKDITDGWVKVSGVWKRIYAGEVSQVIALPASRYGPVAHNSRAWTFDSASATPSISAELVSPGQSRFLYQVRLISLSGTSRQVSATIIRSFVPFTGGGLSAAFGTGGTVTITTSTGESITLASSDSTGNYTWRFSDTARRTAFDAMFAALGSSGETGTLTLTAPR